MTLTQAATLTKKTVIASIAFVISIVIVMVGYNLWHQYYLSTLPPVEEKPEMKFGTLPPLNFPPSQVSATNYSYTLDTQTGDLPTTPKLMKVYFVPQGRVSLLDPDKAQKLAQQMGFGIGPEKVSDRVVEYADETGGQISIDLPTANFHFRKAEASTSATDNSAPPSEDDIIKNFKDYLAFYNLLPDELRNSKAAVNYDNFPTNLAKTATVTIWPPEISDGTEQIPVVTPDYNFGLIKAIVKGGTDKTQMFTEVDYTYWPPDLTTFSTYPLKTATQAFEDLKSGKAYISQQPTNPQVSIATVSLAYYQTEEYSPYLQPVFVFTGPNFTAIVPAISSGN